ncbi:RNase A-like domain-containing protein [Streptomyces triticagri]|nr:RNase A-like domain-containing protein [Streptomyces triticagri]
MFAALWATLQIFAISAPTRSVRWSTLLLALVCGVYVCGLATALAEVAYTRAYTDSSGTPLHEVTRATSYLVAPWVEELTKMAPLLIAGMYVKVRRQWGVTDFVVVGAGLGAGFGLLESVLRYGLDADRARPHAAGGWLIPDSIFPPYVPGVEQILGSWLPAPSGQSALVGGPAAVTFTHLVWTALAGLGAGLVLRGRGPWRLLALVPVAAAVAHHTVTNYAAAKHTSEAKDWLESLDSIAWAAPLVCLAVAIAIDLRCLHRARRAVPEVSLAAERIDGDRAAALLGYASRRPRWTVPIAVRYVRLRRSLLYATADSTRSPESAAAPLREAVLEARALIDSTDNQHTWRSPETYARIRAARARSARHRWLLLIPCLLALPALLFLGVGAFPTTAGLQQYFTSGSGPWVLLCFSIAGMAWIGWILVMLLRTWRPTAAQPIGELLAAHRFRFGTALGSATAGVLLLIRGLGDAGPEGDAIPPAHLLNALNDFVVYLGFALLLLSLLSLFPPGGLAVAGGGALAQASTAGALKAAGFGVLLMAAGAGGSGFGPGDYNAWPRSKRKGRTKPEHRADLKGDEGKNGAHTLARHVRKKTHEMRDRLRKDPTLGADSRFINEASAQKFTDATLLQHQKAITKWLQSGRSRTLKLHGQFAEDTGLHLSRRDFVNGRPTSTVRNVRVILRRDPASPSGYRVHTSFPVP